MCFEILFAGFCYKLSNCFGIDEMLIKQENLNTSHMVYSVITSGESTQPIQELSFDEAACRIQHAYKAYRKRKQNQAKRNYGRSLLSKNEIHQKTRSCQAIRDMFTPSKNRFAMENMNVSSASAVSMKYYSAGTSLFMQERETVMVFGGFDPHSPYGVGRNTGKDIFRYVPDINAWEYVGDMPEPRHHHEVQFLKGRVYLVGGSDPRSDDVRGKNVVCDTCWSFEPVTRSWYREGPLITARKHFGLVICHHCMYAIGGINRRGETLDSVEKFNPIDATWVETTPLKCSRAGAAYTKYRNYIWVAGGLTGNKKQPLTDSVESFDTKTNQWTEITKLMFPRCYSRFFLMSDKLYIIGGAGKLNVKDKATESTAAIDMWDANCTEWKPVTEMTIARHGHAVAYLGTQMLIIGGVTTIYMRALSNSECFCTQRGTWVRGLACLPIPLSGHAAVTLPPAILMSNN